jgi:UDP-N-acetylglucosamine--N-acetylmuramyl-(pentapeptide) pyrophosphoryl-undecaprenol N-acetylglucosamine transferase
MSRVLIMAGGTGGHVFPGLAVARSLIARRVQVVWLGTRKGIEVRAVPASGLPIDMEWVSIRGLRRTKFLNWLLAPATLLYAMFQALRVLRRRRPDVVLSLGGFVAGPGGLMAWLTRTPLLVHEANAIPGMTSKWLSLIARAVLTGFPGVFPARARTRHVGNPVRPEIAAIAPPEERLAARAGRLRLLVVGGSQGARVFNEVLPEAARSLPDEAWPEIRHQCGRGNRPAVEAAYGRAPVPPRITEFIDDMAEAYAWADVVLCRAGAMTVAELAASGSCAILVPYPYAVDDHQTANARYLAERGAAVLLPQGEFTPARLGELLRGLASQREPLLRMARAARACAMPDAAEVVADMCLEAIHA